MKRDFLSSNFAATDELLGSCNQSGDALHDYSDPGSVPILPWIPHTGSAVALRLFELDASITYRPEEKPEPTEDKEFREYIVSVFSHLSLEKSFFLVRFAFGLSLVRGIGFSSVSRRKCCVKIFVSRLFVISNKVNLLFLSLSPEPSYEVCF